MPTDTIHGVVCRADNKEALKRIYAIKGRDTTKRLTYIVASPEDITRLGIDEAYIPHVASLLADIVRPTSFDMPISDARMMHLGCGHDSIAVRIVTDMPQLQELLTKTGPLATTSANYSGKDVVLRANDARSHFGEKIDYYEDHGQIEGCQSALWKIRIDQKPTIIRE